MFTLSPQFWIVIALMIIGAGATGFVKGIEWEQGKNARTQVEVLIKRVKDVKTVIKKDNSTVSSLQEENAKIGEELHDVRQKFAAIREELNKRTCTLPSDTIQLLNYARGTSGFASDSSNTNPTVRTITPPPGWATGGSSKPNDR